MSLWAFKYSYQRLSVAVDRDQLLPAHNKENVDLTFPGKGIYYVKVYYEKDINFL